MPIASESVATITNVGDLQSARQAWRRFGRCQREMRIYRPVMTEDKDGVQPERHGQRDLFTDSGSMRAARDGGRRPPRHHGSTAIDSVNRRAELPVSAREGCPESQGPQYAA